MLKLIRGLLAVFILGLLFYFVGAADLVDALLKVKLFYVVLLLILSAIMIWTSCLKWRLFIQAGGRDAKILRLMELYTVGYFVNTFTPSFVGGDVVRSLHLGRDLASQRDAFVATFLERFTGLLAMAFLGVLFVLLGAPATAGLSIAILLVGFMALTMAIVCFSKSVGALAFRLLDSLLLALPQHTLITKVQGLVKKVDQSMAFARGNKALVFESLVLSLAFHFLTVVNTYVAARAVAWDSPSFMGLFVVVPLVLLVSMVPITPSGLGIQEGAFLFLLKRIGATDAQGLGVGVVLRAKTMLLAVIGGLLWAWVRKRERVQA